MKRFFLKIVLPALVLAGAVFAAESCSKTDKKMIEINNSLTAAEKAAGLLTPDVMWKMRRVASTSLSPDGQQVVCAVTEYSMADNRGVSSLWIMNRDGSGLRRMTDNTGNDTDPVWSADSKRIYFLSDRSGSTQLWRMNAKRHVPVQISEIEDGIEAFGVSPEGERIYYVKRVKVAAHNSSELYPDMDKSQAKIYDDLMARHWNYWDDGSYLHIFVTSTKDGRMLRGEDIMEGEPWDAPMAPYFDGSEIAWNRSGTQLAYTCKKLTGTDYAISTDSDIYLYDLLSKSTMNLTRGMYGYDRYPRFSPDGRKVAFTSMEREGNESDKERLFTVDLLTDERRELTAGFDYNALGAVWEGNDRLCFIAPVEATHQVCRVGVDGGAVEVLTAGDHDINSLSLAATDMGTVAVGEVTTLSMATEIFDIALNGGAMTRISDFNKEVYDNIRFGAVEKRWVPTTDGKQELVWIVTPPDFDSTKKYPALLYCQGGPQSVVSQGWSYRWNFQLMAARGYVVVAPNRRGLPSFGQEWLDQISGDYSGQNIRDYLSAIDNAAAEPWIDADRLGCVGASYGGYSVFYLAGHHQGRFKAFISHCGIFNEESMYGETEELWFLNNDLGGPYWSTDPTAVRSYANSPHKSVQNWDTPILIITGANDFRIPYTQSLQAFTAARVLDVPARLVFFENEAHQVFKPQNSIVWNREFFGWLDKYLKDKE